VRFGTVWQGKARNTYFFINWIRTIKYGRIYTIVEAEQEKNLQSVETARENIRPGPRPS